ncbi:MAG: hypothetical protein R3321_08115 [Nitrososphaeraceae archaeon]|nr:hypothetical protein [Nitrososphaeraceae archaeon]
MAFDNHDNIISNLGYSLEQTVLNNIRSNIALSIKRAILKIAPGELEIITYALKSEFSIYLFDIFDHPDYLKQILNYYYKDKYSKIVDIIENELGELTKNKICANFIRDLRLQSAELCI